MVARKALLTASVAGFLVSCVSSHRDDVIRTMANRIENNGKSVTVSGILRERGGYYNLFSNDGKECIGILLTDRQRREYRRFADHRVTVAGTLEAEGCGREGICVERLCGPTIMTGVTVSR